MKHDKIEEFPYGMTNEEINALFRSEDVYDVLETFDTLEDALNFIKETYDIIAYEYARKNAEESINEEKDFIKYMHEKGELNYVGYTTFDIYDIVEKQMNNNREPSFVWFSTGKVARVVFH